MCVTNAVSQPISELGFPSSQRNLVDDKEGQQALGASICLHALTCIVDASVL